MTGESTSSAGTAVQSPQGLLISEFGFRLGRAHRALRAVWEQSIADLRISPPQAAVLRAVSRHEACGLRALARGLGTDVMNLRRLADHLEQSGLVQVLPDPEHSQRRVVRATSAGVAVSEQLAARASALNQLVEQLLGRDDLVQLQGLLEKLQTILADPSIASQAQKLGSGRANTYEGTE